MPSESATPEEPSETTADALALVAGDTPTLSGAEKGAATVKRHKQERRADKLDQMLAQIADGTLIVRQMTIANTRQHRKSPATRLRGPRGA